jgi:hypothetical protein
VLAGGPRRFQELAGGPSALRAADAISLVIDRARDPGFIPVDEVRYPVHHVWLVTRGL